MVKRTRQGLSTYRRHSTVVQLAATTPTFKGFRGPALYYLHEVEGTFNEHDLASRRLKL